jgi:2-dehydropantoate 2-reductase
MTLSIGILGLGALGTLMAWHWRDHDCMVISKDGKPVFRQLVTANNTDQLQLAHWQNENLDWLVITTKAADTLSAITPLAEHLHRIKRIVLLQNGMGQQEAVANWLSTQSKAPELWLASSTEGAYRQNHNDVVYAGQGQTLIGRYQEGLDQDTQDHDCLPSNTVYVPDMLDRLRHKLAINAVINPLTALYRCHNGELVRHSDYRQHLQRLAAEIAGLYAFLNWSLPWDLITQAEQIATATAANQSSTLQDVLQQRPTELPYINGYLLAQAEQHGYALPHCAELMTQLGN